MTPEHAAIRGRGFAYTSSFSELTWRGHPRPEDFIQWRSFRLVLS